MLLNTNSLRATPRHAKLVTATTSDQTGHRRLQLLLAVNIQYFFHIAADLHSPTVVAFGSRFTYIASANMDDLHENMATLTCGATGDMASLSESQNLRAHDMHGDNGGAPNKTANAVTQLAFGDEPNTIASEKKSAAEGEHESLEVGRAPCQDE